MNNAIQSSGNNMKVYEKMNQLQKEKALSDQPTVNICDNIVRNSPIVTVDV